MSTVNSKISHYLEDCPAPRANPDAIESSDLFLPLFNQPVPALDKFQLEEDDSEKMKGVWPEGEEAAAQVRYHVCSRHFIIVANSKQVLQRFLDTKSRSQQLGAVDPLAPGSEESVKHNRAAKYSTQRDRTDSDTTSRLRCGPCDFLLIWKFTRSTVHT